jgi:hypothetical protein
VTEALLGSTSSPPPERDVDASPNLRDQHCQHHPPSARILKLDSTHSHWAFCATAKTVGGLFE